MGILVLLALGLLGWYIWACVSVGLIYLAVRFWWVLAVAGIVAAVAARAP